MDSSSVRGDGGSSHRSESAGASRDSVELQAALFGYADTYIALTRQGADALMTTDRTPARRVRSIHAKLDGAQDVIEIVTGPNPTVALLDLAVMVTIQRKVWDEYWSTTVFTDGSGADYSEAMAKLDAAAWRIVDETIPAKEAAALRRLADDLHRQYRDQVYVTSFRASKIARGLSAGDPARPPESLLTLFGLDPLADLSPAVAEVTKARLLAERVFYYSQKAPALLGWRGELLLSATMTFPEVQKTLGDVDTALASTKRFATLAEELPEVIAKNRAEAITQAGDVMAAQVSRLDGALQRERAALLEGVADERRAVLEAFDTRHAEVESVLEQTRRTIEAANELSVAVKGVLTDARAFEGSMGASSGPPGHPFDIREYHRAIEAATGTLKELNTAVQSAKELVDSPEWREREATISRLADDLQGRAVRLVAYASLGLFLAMSGSAVVRWWMFRRAGTPAAGA